MYNAQNYQQAYAEFTKTQRQENVPAFTPPKSVTTVDEDTTSYSNGRRARTLFTNYQLMELEREFQKCFFLHRTRRIDIAKRLGLNESQVKVWFQNRRMKLKKSSFTSNGTKNLKAIRADHIVVRKLISSDSQICNRSTNDVQTPVKTLQRLTCQNLPVIKPLKAEVVTNPLDVPDDLPIVIQNQAKLPILIQNQAARTFKPQVLVKIPAMGIRVSKATSSPTFSTTQLIQPVAIRNTTSLVLPQDMQISPLFVRSQEVQIPPSSLLPKQVHIAPSSVRSQEVQIAPSLVLPQEVHIAPSSVLTQDLHISPSTFLPQDMEIDNFVQQGCIVPSPAQEQLPQSNNIEVNPVQQNFDSNQQFSYDFQYNQLPEQLLQEQLDQQQCLEQLFQQAPNQEQCLDKFFQDLTNHPETLPNSSVTPDSDQNQFDYQDLLSTLDTLIEPKREEMPPVKLETSISFDQIMDTEASIDLHDFMSEFKDELPNLTDQTDFKEPSTPELLKVLDDIIFDVFPEGENDFLENFVKPEPKPEPEPVPIVNFSFENLMTPDSKPIVTVTF